jgi:hypothetical protein
MVQTIHLQPHDPLPSPAEDHVLVVARFASSNPSEKVVEVSVNSPALRTGPTPASRAQNGPRDLEDAVRMATAFAQERGIPRVYAVDRTGGEIERRVADRNGDRNLEGVRLRDFNE